MSIVRIPIDVKSFYFNIQNDNATGHTPTVSTPIRQGSSIRSELAGINEIPEKIHNLSREGIISLILTKSRAQAKIDRVLVFDQIAVNWHCLKTPVSFCFYIREETDPNNVHCGRLKLHYPQTLQYADESISIDNHIVIKTVSDYLHDYAFIVEAFEYDTESGVLNFDVTIVGENLIPYSKVFVNRRGVGNKFTAYFNDAADVYDTEIISLREKMGYNNVLPENFDEIYCKNNRVAYSRASDILVGNGSRYIRILKNEYPYSLYDIQYSVGNEKHYIIVKQTATELRYFSLPIGKVRFCNDFPDFVQVWLFTDIAGAPKLTVYTANEINHLNKSISSISYSDRRE